MIQTISEGHFRDAFHHMGREKQFSYEGLKVLFEHLEEVNENYDLDVIELCCEYTESTHKEALKSYSLESIEELRNNTTVLDIDDNTIIYITY